MLFQDRFGFTWEKTLVCVGVWGLPHLPPTVCQPQWQDDVQMRVRLRHVGATDFSPNSPFGLPQHPGSGIQTGVPAPQLSLMRPKSRCWPSLRPSQTGDLPPPGLLQVVGRTQPVAVRLRSSVLAAGGRGRSQPSPIPAPSSPHTHGPCHSRAAHFSKASRRISLLLLPFFFCLIKSHPPRMISPDFPGRSLYKVHTRLIVTVYLKRI